MQWTSIIAIYLLIWIACAFMMLPFGIRTHDEVGEDKIPGQADSAPANFKPLRLALLSMLVSVVVTTLFVQNFDRGWVTLDDVNFFHPPPDVN